MPDQVLDRAVVTPERVTVDLSHREALAVHQALIARQLVVRLDADHARGLELRAALYAELILLEDASRRLSIALGLGQR